MGRSAERRRGHPIPLDSERRSGAPLASQSTRRSPDRGAPPNGTKGGNGRPTAAAPATSATSSRNLVLQLAGSAGAQRTSGGNGGRARRRTNRSYLMREALRSHQRSSEAIRGDQRQSEVIRGPHRRPEWRAASSSVYPIAPSPETSQDVKSRSLSSTVT